MWRGIVRAAGEGRGEELQILDFGMRILDLDCRILDLGLNHGVSGA